MHNGNSLNVACRNFDVACRHFRCGVRHFEVSSDRLFLIKRFFETTKKMLKDAVQAGSNRVQILIIMLRWNWLAVGDCCDTENAHI